MIYEDPTGLIKEGDEKLTTETQILINGINMDGNGGLSLKWEQAQSDIERRQIEIEADKLRKKDIFVNKRRKRILWINCKKGVPPSKEDGYIAPKKGRDNGSSRGWIDKNGNIWVPVPDGAPNAHGGGHWDVQRPDGRGYTNRYPGGYERPGKGIRPNIPKISSDNIIEAGKTAIGIYVVYKIVKIGASAVIGGPIGAGVAAITP